MIRKKQVKFLFQNEKSYFYLAFRNLISSVTGNPEYTTLQNKELHNPGENFKAKGYITTENTPELLREHLDQTKGLVRTRFPPEPNGILHLGHARALNINFGYASLKKGVCLLRYDDTNPETAKYSFIPQIEESIKWLGFSPHEISYTSDYFPQLYKLAQNLIKKDLAYVCHQSVEQMNCLHPNPSPWIFRPIEESLDLFEKMNSGYFKEGDAILRLKHTTDQGAVHPVAYRIKFHPHPRTGTKWKAYPMYDFAHCLSDSIENITHSFCTAEFELRRSTYYWICNAAEVYCPVQTEFGRLNMQYTVTSKRKIMELIKTGNIKGWDDPRLLTLPGLRRRGVPPEVINELCQELGWKRESSFLDPTHLEELTRRNLLKSIPRVMAVKNPLRVRIVNFPFDSTQNIEIDTKSGKQTVVFDREIWLDGGDFREEADKNYHRLTKTQTLGLKHVPYAIKLCQIVRKEDGEVDHIEVTCHLKSDLGKQRAYVQWVSHPLVCESREFGFLLNSPFPEGANLRENLNKDSLKTIAIYTDQWLAKEAVGRCFQFDRLGFYRIDEESTCRKLILNCIVSLKKRSF